VEKDRNIGNLFMNLPINTNRKAAGWKYLRKL
jgi:hypothetical protein